MNPDLARERSKASFNVEELTNVLDGGKNKTERRRYLENIVTSRKDLDHPVDYLFMDRGQQYEQTLSRGILSLKICNEHNITEPLDIALIQRAIGIPMPFSLHRVMFMPCLQSMGTEEQKEKWLPLAQNFHILGTYAQTELGHGTYVRGLETTATFDKNTQEFVLHSPTKSASKWWPGFLGHTSTHAIVVARLIVDGREYGIQFFIVQLRDLETHQPMPGITVGDIGPKLCTFYNAVDNGCLKLSHVRIPRDNMLMAKTKVSPEGKVSSSGSSKHSYGTMTYVRSVIPADMAMLLSNAVTIAIRYSIVRRQSEIKPGEGEVQVMDFKTQQYELLPILATTYAMYFCAKRLMREHGNFMKEIKAGNNFRLQEMHSITSGCKSFLTSLALHCCETCTLCCGGHGFSMFSALPELTSLCTAACIYEGENKILLLQVARYLLKCTRNVLMGKGQLPSTVAYLGCDDNGEIVPVFSDEQLLNPTVQLQIITLQSKRMIFHIAQKIQALVMSGTDQVEAWNTYSPQLLKCAKAHSFYLSFLYFTDIFHGEVLNTSSPVKNVLKNLCDLYVLHHIAENSGSFLEFGVLNGSQIGLVKDQVSSLIGEIRPDAVSLVDAFDISDRNLRSALGKYDGNVYEQLFDWAKRDPVNKQQVRPGYYKYLRPLLKHGKSKL